MTQTNATIELAEEMSGHLQDLSEDRLCWLVLRNLHLSSLPDFSPESLLVVEMMRRIWPDISEVAHVAPFGYIMQDGSVMDYREPLENENE